MDIYGATEVAFENGRKEGRGDTVKALLRREGKIDMKWYRETVTELNSMIPEIHGNAVVHGWWSGKRSFWEIYALIHSELSEALEEYRAGQPEVYCSEHGGDWCPNCYGETCAIAPEMDCITCFRLAEESGKVPHKPEGVLVELADVVIRILDYLGHEGETLAAIDGELVEGDAGFGGMIAVLHAALSTAWLQRVTGNAMGTEYNETALLSAVVKTICQYAGIVGHDLVWIVRLKHKYNVTRSYKHGGKRI